MYSASELAAKLCRAQAGKFAGEATRDPKFFCQITYGFPMQTCGLVTSNSKDVCAVLWDFLSVFER